MKDLLHCQSNSNDYRVVCRVSVIRGRVVSREGNGLIGIRVSVATDPQFGFTLTRSDGWDGDGVFKLTSLKQDWDVWKSGCGTDFKSLTGHLTRIGLKYTMSWRDLLRLCMEQ
ncbi:hypothetical protein CDAR_467421 [Caerostris darwini]|uniref:Teneurin TTR-like domain-containing protein n=1 Tax=Caerostris darwini TaxID=1538125 RepID=A0AAV4RUG7_9ARAC|nr:hypothetical protein CDAR_467421 [Caerostris darwini]